MELDLPDKELQKIMKTGIAVRLGLFKGVKEAMFYSEGKAKRNFGGAGQLQVRSGHLRRSIKTSVKEGIGEIVGNIGSNVIYAATHEFGDPSRNIPARPFITPALTNNSIEIKRIIQKAIKREVDKR